MSDVIRIEGLHLRTILGVHDWERREKQDVLIDLALELDLGEPARTDALEDSVDYRALTKAVIAHVEGSDYRLVEALAGSIAALALERFRRLDAVTVRVQKPGALRFARSVCVELRRERGG